MFDKQRHLTEHHLDVGRDEPMSEGSEIGNYANILLEKKRLKEG